jgi:hypothetical protein
MTVEIEVTAAPRKPAGHAPQGDRSPMPDFPEPGNLNALSG